MTTETPKFFDALPYIDTIIDDDEEKKEQAMNEVDDEMLSFPPYKDYLSHLDDINDRPFLTPFLIQSAIEQPNSNRSNQDIAKLEVDIPPPVSELQDLAQWNKSVDKLKIKLEYRVRQQINLDLIKTYGSPAWEQYLAKTERIYSELNNELLDLNKRMQEINWARNKDQEQTKRTLLTLKSELDKLVDQNFILSKEVEKLEAPRLSC